MLNYKINVRLMYIIIVKVLKKLQDYIYNYYKYYFFLYELMLVIERFNLLLIVILNNFTF